MSSTGSRAPGKSAALFATSPPVVGVKRLAEYLRRKLDGDPNLRSVFVRGEVSNLRMSPPGHWNFDLTEGDALLKCFAWGQDACRFTAFGNGTAVIASGKITTYPGRSTYQLIVRAVEPQGFGDVHTLFEERKKRLAAQGLFALERKRPLPRFPFRVALVSSRTANGALDFTTILHERAPHVVVVWCETPVQGPSAPADICAALARASRANVDLIVVTRGGGSFEDLFVFSDENVVRMIAEARHPVISAIGHTADQQLCDYAADRHVETPTAAAKIIGPELTDLHALLESRLGRARTCVMLHIERLHVRLAGALVRSKLVEPGYFLAPLAQRLDDALTALGSRTAARLRERELRHRAVTRSLGSHDPSRRLAERERRLHAAQIGLDVRVKAAFARAARRSDEIGKRLGGAATGRWDRATRSFEVACARLTANDPTAILQRGYAIVTHDGAILRDPAAVRNGTLIHARLARGTLQARVEAVAHGDGSIR